MKKFYHSFLIAFSMYSKIPMPQCEWNEENMAYAMCFFPWIGVAIGGVTWLWGRSERILAFLSLLYRDPDIDPMVSYRRDPPGRIVGYGRCDEFMAGT